MVNITPAPQDISVKEVVDEIMRDQNKFECVIVLAIHKTGEQYLRTSFMDQHRRSFLLSFFSAWVLSWFDFGVRE